MTDPVPVRRETVEELVAILLALGMAADKPAKAELYNRLWRELKEGLG